MITARQLPVRSALKSISAYIPVFDKRVDSVIDDLFGDSGGDLDSDSDAESIDSHKLRKTMGSPLVSDMVSPEQDRWVLYISL
jgi:hypothetical protein